MQKRLRYFVRAIEDRPKLLHVLSILPCLGISLLLEKNPKHYKFRFSSYLFLIILGDSSLDSFHSYCHEFHGADEQRPSSLQKLSHPSPSASASRRPNCKFQFNNDIYLSPFFSASLKSMSLFPFQNKFIYSSYSHLEILKDPQFFPPYPLTNQSNSLIFWGKYASPDLPTINLFFPLFNHTCKTKTKQSSLELLLLEFTFNSLLSHFPHFTSENPFHNAINISPRFKWENLCKYLFFLLFSRAGQFHSLSEA